jgi:hypothetical protein
MRKATALIAATLLISAVQLRSQSGPAVYKVEFDIRNGGEGKDQSVQHYSMLLDESRKGVFQAANRVPVPGSTETVDAGVKIECIVQASGGKAALQGDIELTAITGYVNLSAISQPIIGQRKMTFQKTVELGTPTLVIDGRNAPAAAPGGHQVEATVTKVN